MDPPANVIAQSQSGTGKTAAFSLPCASRVDLGQLRPQALVLAPSRELALQIPGVITHMSQFMQGLETMAAIPDSSRCGMKYQELHEMVSIFARLLRCRRHKIEPCSLLASFFNCDKKPGFNTCGLAPTVHDRIS